MGESKIPYCPYKTTLLGKLFNAVSWLMLVLTILISVLMMAEECSIGAILFAGVMLLTGVGLFLGIQALIALYEETCDAKKKARTPNPPVPEKPPVSEKPHAPVQETFSTGHAVYVGMDDLCCSEVFPQEQGVRLFIARNRRRVIYYTERYPCFDEYDRLHEKRRYHYFLISEGRHYANTLWSLVRFPDEMVGAEVLSECILRKRMEEKVPSYVRPLMEKVERMNLAPAKDDWIRQFFVVDGQEYPYGSDLAQNEIDMEKSGLRVPPEQDVKVYRDYYQRLVVQWTEQQAEAGEPRDWYAVLSGGQWTALRFPHKKMGMPDRTMEPMSRQEAVQRHGLNDRLNDLMKRLEENPWVVLLSGLLSGPDGADGIPDGAFAGSGLKELRADSFAYTVKQIGRNAFAGSTQLEQALLRDSVGRIGSGAFAGCTSLRRVLIGENVTQLSADVFRNCPALERIILRGDTRMEGDFGRVQIIDGRKSGIEKIEGVRPGCAEGRYVVKCEAYDARSAEGMLFWADADGALKDHMSFGQVKPDSFGEGEFYYPGGRAVPPGATHVQVKTPYSQAIYPIPEEMLSAPAQPGVRFGLMSDLHYAAREKNIRKALHCVKDVDCLLIAGDLTNSAEKRQFVWLKEVIDSILPDVPVLCVPGNHDFPERPLPLCGEEMADYPAFQEEMLSRARRLGVCVEQHPSGAWRAQVGGVDIFGIWSNTHWRRFKFPRGEQLEWLRQELSDSQTERKLVLCHAPLHAHNLVRRQDKIRTPYLSRDDQLQKIVDEHRGICFLSGHTHVSMNELEGSVSWDEAKGNIYIDDGSVTPGKEYSQPLSDDVRRGQVIKLGISADGLEIRTICTESGRYIPRGYYRFGRLS